MANLFDYLEWRGDLSFDEKPLNDVDAVILSRLSYLEFDGIVSHSFDSFITLENAAELFLSTPEKLDAELWKGDNRLLEALAKSERYRDVRLSGFCNIIEDSAQMQFAALTVSLSDSLRFISFRGTDNSLTGWQEDFNMFCEFPLPSQQKALEYLSQAAALDGNLIAGGHSKGGNLAVYASAFCEEQIQRRITAIYNLDGPGFEQKVIDAGCFDGIKDRIRTYVPQSSVFGMMFEHSEEYTVIKSSQKGFFQHDVYSWEISVTQLVTLCSTNSVSAFASTTLSSFVGGMSRDERKKLTQAVFDILRSTEGKTFKDITDNLMHDATTMLRSLKNLDSPTRSLIASGLLSLIKSAGGGFSEINPLSRENRTKHKKKQQD